MELIKTAIFIQGLVWAIQLLSGPPFRSRLYAVSAILLISIAALLDYLELAGIQIDRNVTLIDFYLVVGIMILLNHYLLDLISLHYKLIDRLIVFLPITGIPFMIIFRAVQTGSPDNSAAGMSFLLLLILYAVCLFHTGRYFYLYLIKGNYVKGLFGDLRIVKFWVVYGMVLFIWLMVLMVHITGNPEIEETVMKYLGIPVAILIFFWGFMETRRSPEKTFTVPVKQAVQSEITRTIMDLMEKERTYRDNDYSLDRMANQLGIQPYELTRILNHDLKTSFYDLVNSYRVKEVKQRLGKDDQRYFTLLAIAFECGFNSKSTFNRVFKEFTGKTPSEYARMNTG